MYLGTIQYFLKGARSTSNPTNPLLITKPISNESEAAKRELGPAVRLNTIQVGGANKPIEEPSEETVESDSEEGEFDFVEENPSGKEDQSILCKTVHFPGRKRRPSSESIKSETASATKKPRKSKTTFKFRAE